MSIYYNYTLYYTNTCLYRSSIRFRTPCNGKYGFGMSVMGLLMKILNDRILRKGDTAVKGKVAVDRVSGHIYRYIG